MTAPASPCGADALAARRSNTLGVLLMAAATAVLAGMHALVRHVSAELHPFEIAFFRNLFGLVVVLPLLLRTGWAGLRTRQPLLHGLRGLLSVTAMLTWFYGLSVVPIAEATALSFTAVLFASLGAVLILGERMRLTRWVGILLGFSGAMLILRPGWQQMDAGVLIVLVSALAWGSATVVVKRLARTDSIVAIVGWMTIAITVASLPPALMVWQWPTPVQLFWLGAIGALGTAGHLAMTKALKVADTTVVLPLDFTRLLWASLFGYLAFAELPDAWTWAGGAVIVLGATLVIYWESRTGPARRVGA